MTQTLPQPNHHRAFQVFSLEDRNLYRTANCRLYHVTGLQAGVWHKIRGPSPSRESDTGPLRVSNTRFNSEIQYRMR